MPFPWEYERTVKRNRRMRRGFEREARLAGFNTIARRTAQAQGIDPEIVPQRPTMFDKQMITGRHLDAELEDLPQKRGGGGLLGKIGGAIDDATSFVFGGEIREPWDLLRPLKRALDAEQRYISRPLAEGIFELTGQDYEGAPGIVKFGLEALTSPSTFIGPDVAGKLAKVAGLPGARFAAKESTGRYLAQNVGGALGATVGGEVAEQVGLPRAVGGLPGAIVASSALVRGAKPKPPVAEAGGAKGDLPHPGSRAGFRNQAANFGTTEGDDALRGSLNESGRVARQEARDAAGSMEGFWPRWEEDAGYGTLDLDTMGVQPLLVSRLERLRNKVNGAKRPLGKGLRELGTLEAQKFVDDMRQQGLPATTIMNNMAERIEESIDQFRRTPRSAQQVAFEAELNRLWDEPAFLPFEELGLVGGLGTVGEGRADDQPNENGEHESCRK